MPRRLLPLIPAGLVVDDVQIDAERIIVETRPRGASARCPDCLCLSIQIHSHYVRSLSDLPWQGRRVVIRVRTRRWRCGRSGCARQTFTERLRSISCLGARRTERLDDLHRHLGLALGGEAGARMAARLGIPVAPDTLLRLIRREAQDDTGAGPRVLGVDDWAWRRGQRYGTVLVDLESNRIVDLLPDRDGATLAHWLAAHPGVEIIARDRAGAYAQGARLGAPAARQVADRWHMLRNCSDALLDVVEKQYRVVRDVSASLAAASAPGLLSQPPDASETSKAARQRRESRANREAMYDNVMALHQKGWSLSAIRRETGHDPKTVRKWLNDKRPGTWQRRDASGYGADDFADYLHRRWDEGCRNATRLYREICEQGYQGHARNFRRWVKVRLRDAMPASIAPKGSLRSRVPCPPSPRLTTRLLTGPVEALSRDALAFVKALHAASPSIAAAADLARRFQTMLTERDVDALTPWLAEALDSSLASFARGLRRDIDAVRAALTTPWSTGPVEGKIHKLKLIKRSMYGRAHIDLLRARLMA